MIEIKLIGLLKSDRQGVCLIAFQVLSPVETSPVSSIISSPDGYVRKEKWVWETFYVFS